MEEIKVFIYRLLRKSERYAKTDMIYATKSGFWLMVGQIFGAVVSLILSILFAHYLPKETFGIYRYILSMAGIATAFSLTGINAAVTRAVAQGFEGSFKQSILVQIKWSIPQFLFALALSIYYFYQSNVVYGICFLIVAVCHTISGTANTYNAFLNGKKDFKRATYYGLVSNAIYFIVMAIVSVYYPNTIALIAGFYLSGTIINVYFCWKIIKDRGNENLLTRGDEDIKYSKNLSIMNMAGTIAQQIDSITIYHFLGPAQLAIYTFSTIIPERIRSMFGIISTAAFPKLAEKDTENTQAALKHKVFRLLGLSVLIILVYIVAAPFIYKIFFPQYLDTVFYSQVFSISILAIASNIPVPALFTQKRQKELYIVSVGLPIIKIIISIFAIIMWGIWGAIISKIFHYLLHIVVSTYLASRPSIKTS